MIRRVAPCTARLRYRRPGQAPACFPYRTFRNVPALKQEAEKVSRFSGCEKGGKYFPALSTCAPLHRMVFCRANPRPVHQGTHGTGTIQCPLCAISGHSCPWDFAIIQSTLQVAAVRQLLTGIELNWAGLFQFEINGALVIGYQCFGMRDTGLGKIDLPLLEGNVPRVAGRSG